ncbi:thyrostimulin beta-5 subunit [Musca domestica]|uniref:Glycoprotein hormone beta-5 n=1 Tax=Musca domestica TaxID=7370 RepID=A0A1I8MWK3_MUSDO|nr:thyrostimulin beta-5 subunit [Musca domestica]
MRCLNLIFFIALWSGTLAQVLDVMPMQPINSGGSPPNGHLGCHRKQLTYRVTQADSKGRECWDYVSVSACWGHCDSSEISDWKFPYKRSFHPVCVHATRQPAVVLLGNCHPEADEEARRYEYLEAVSCHCHTCSTMDTSCEAPANNILDVKSGVKVLALTGMDSDGLDY